MGGGRVGGGEWEGGIVLYCVEWTKVIKGWLTPQLLSSLFICIYIFYTMIAKRKGIFNKEDNTEDEDLLLAESALLCPKSALFNILGIICPKSAVPI